MARDYSLNYSGYEFGQVAVNPYPLSEPSKEQALPKIKRRVKPKISVNATLTAVLILAVFLLLFRFALINEISSNNTKLEQELTKQTIATDMAKLELDRTTDLNYVEAVAKEKLGMDFPQSHQVVNVTLKYPDKAVVSKPAQPGVFESIGNFFGGILEYLY